MSPPRTPAPWPLELAADGATRALERTLLQEISEATGDVIFAKDREGRMRYANGATLALIGKPLEQVLGRTDAEFLDEPDAARQVMENDRRVMERGVTEEVEERLRRPDGTQSVWLSRKSPWRDADGNVVGLLGISRDITERKAAAEALLASEERYRTLFTNMTEGFALGEAICDDAAVPRDFRFLEMNDAFEIQSGLDREATRGRPMRELLPRLEQSWVDTYCGVALGGPPVRFESHNADLDRHFSVYCFSPERGRFAILFTDVTERRRAEEAARKSQELLRSTMDHFPTVIAFKDREGRFIDVNRAVEQALGLPKEAIVGRTIHDFVPKEAADVLWRHDVEVMEQRRAMRREEVTPLPGGTLYHLDTNFPLVAPDGEVYGTGHISYDITELKRAEVALREANDRLREADRRKDEFLGMLSHELRNPLAPIRSSVHVLEHADPSSDRAHRARAVIKRQTEHLTRLVDDLLDLTRIARGKIELRRERIDLREVVSRAADDFRLMMDDRGVALRTATPPAPVWVDADATRITQIVGNLLHNAAKFTRRGDEVLLSLAREGSAARVSVRDTGAGIDAALLPSIFDPFVQGERTLARTEGGLGLGLALVKGITELHGGTVQVESAGQGQGAEFTIALPLAKLAAASARGGGGIAATRGGRRVLVVDDNADAADSLAELLRILGHDVEVAYDGPAAIAAVRACAPDVVLCDIGLPGMDGYEVARVLRAEAAGVRLVAVSGYAQPEDVQRALEAGFDAHIAKPPDPAELDRLIG